MTKHLDRDEFEQANVFGTGTPNPWGAYFTGEVRALLAEVDAAN